MERHGHVVPTPSGLRARCGGPALCEKCQAEVEHLALHLATAVELFLNDDPVGGLPRAKAGAQIALGDALIRYLGKVKG